MSSLNLSTLNPEEEVTSPTSPLLASIITNTVESGADEYSSTPMEFCETHYGNDLPPSTSAPNEPFGTSALSTNEWGASTPSVNGSWEPSAISPCGSWATPAPSTSTSWESPAIATSGAWLAPPWCIKTTKKVAAKPQREFELRISTVFDLPPALVAKLCSDIVDSYVALEEEQLKRQQELNRTHLSIMRKMQKTLERRWCTQPESESNENIKPSSQPHI